MTKILLKKKICSITYIINGEKMKELENCLRDINQSFQQTDKMWEYFSLSGKPIISKCLTHCNIGQYMLTFAIL